MGYETGIDLLISFANTVIPLWNTIAIVWCDVKFISTQPGGAILNFGLKTQLKWLHWVDTHFLKPVNNFIRKLLWFQSYISTSEVPKSVSTEVEHLNHYDPLFQGVKLSKIEAPPQLLVGLTLSHTCSNVIINIGPCHITMSKSCYCSTRWSKTQYLAQKWAKCAPPGWCTLFKASQLFHQKGMMIVELFQSTQFPNQPQPRWSTLLKFKINHNSAPPWLRRICRYQSLL